MEWHVNDLSLKGQFADAEELRTSLEPIIKLRQRRADIRARIYCSRLLGLRPATRLQSLQQAVFAIRDRGFVRLAVEWFANSGPFWDDSRSENADDYFHFEGEDVTDQGLGEAARRRIMDIAAAAFSFSDHSRSFHRSPLDVSHGLPEAPLGSYPIHNVWNPEEIEQASIDPPAVSWRELLAAARRSFAMVVLSSEVEEQLRGTPFHSGAARRISELLGVLQRIAEETQEDGSLGKAGMEILQTQFVGDKAAFTDESDGNKRHFSNEMTFPDPSGGAGLLFCPWHGKVKTPQIRIHFEWPRPKRQRVIKVAYIGPKITKR